MSSVEADNLASQHTLASPSVGERSKVSKSSKSSSSSSGSNDDNVSTSASADSAPKERTKKRSMSEGATTGKKNLIFRSVLDRSLLNNLSLPTPKDVPLMDMLRQRTLSAAADNLSASTSTTQTDSLNTSTSSASSGSGSGSCSSSTNSTASPSPSLVANRFQLGCEIGRGHGGVVMWAIDFADADSNGKAKTKTTVALKVRHCNTAELQEAMQEALMLARVSTLASPHFAAFVDSHVDMKIDGDQLLYEFTIAQEFIAGGDLLRKVAASSPHVDRLPLARWCHQLCVAVSTLHTRSIVHRDIKPENIMLRSDADMTLVLCDFGCAVMVNSCSPSASHVVGSTVYLAPELINAARGSVRPSFAADAWAVGVVLLDLATGMLHSKDGVHKVSAIAAAAHKNAASAAKWRAHLDECLKHLLPETSRWSTAIQSMLRPEVNLRLTVGQAAAMSSGSLGDSVFGDSPSLPSPPLVSQTRQRSRTVASTVESTADDRLRRQSSERRQAPSKGSRMTAAPSSKPRIVERMASMPAMPLSGGDKDKRASVKAVANAKGGSVSVRASVVAQDQQELK
jgi:serine/threonine protein kinase